MRTILTGSFFRSLTGQKALLDGQVQAEEGLNNLKQLQESAFEESRASVLAFTQEAKMHQQEFLAWQMKLQTIHEQLTIGSNAMLEAQVINDIFYSVLTIVVYDPVRKVNDTSKLTK